MREPSATSPNAPRTSLPRRRTIALVAVGLLCVLAVGFFAMSTGGDPQPAVLPNPNGYDDFASASQSMVPWNGDLMTLSPEALRSTVEQNTNALALIRSGLGKECVVPVVNDLNWFTVHMPRVSTHKSMAQLLLAEGIVHLEEGRTNEAARCFADCILFAHASSRGGLLIHDMVGIACQAIGSKQLVPVLPNVSSNALREILRDFIVVEASREPASAIMERDRQWARAAHGPIRSFLTQIVQSKTRRTVEAKFEKRHAHSMAALRLVITELAVRLHEIDKGKPPATLAELVPGWLPAVPIDPFSQRALIYRATGNSFVLYSVGPDGKDDQGRPVSRGNMEIGDLVPTPF